MIRTFVFFGMLLGLVLMGSPVRPLSAETIIPLADIEAGDLIRGQTYPAVYYYGADGFRYVFPTDRLYFTWYANFDTVKWISDVDLGKLQIGGNVTYRPGSKMVKIISDPDTYAVDQGGTLRHVTGEDVAIALYGSDWNTKIDDIADGFFTNYEIGEAITSSSEFVPADVMAEVPDVNTDKSLTAPFEVEITATGYSEEEIAIELNRTVRFVNNDTERHTVTDDALDWGSGTMEAGGMWVRRFDEPGTFTFFDSYDAGNTGTIIVQE